MLESSVERQLAWRRCGMIPIGCLGDGMAVGATMPRQLFAIAAKLERNLGFTGDDLATVCDDAVAHRLTEALWRRGRELEADGRLGTVLPARVEDLGRALSPRMVVELIAGVVSTGFVFDPHAIRMAETGSWSSRVRAQVRRVFASSTTTTIGMAERATREGSTLGVCLDYATASRVLFYALKRALGVSEQVFVVNICGPALDMTNRYQHAWCWFVDGESHSLSAFDASAHGLRSTPRGQRFDYAIDLARYRNVSGFLATSYAASIAAESHIDWNEMFEVLRAVIEPDTDAGQVLLFHLAEHVLIPIDVRRRIAAHLAARAFERIVPAWRQHLARRDEHLGRVLRWWYRSQASHLFAIDALLS